MTHPSELTDHLGYWLRAVSNSVSNAFAGRVASMGVTVAEWVMMRALHGREPTSPSQIADTLGMTRGAISKLADRLVDKDLVVRTANPADGRAQTLALTSRGSALVPALAALADDNDRAFFGTLSESDRAALGRILKQLASQHGPLAAPVT